MTNSSPWYRWPIEINGLPFSKMGGSFHGELLNNQMVSCFFDVESEVPFFLGSVKLSNRVPFQFMDM